jgi:hypothetical protein
MQKYPNVCYLLAGGAAADGGGLAPAAGGGPAGEEGSSSAGGGGVAAAGGEGVAPAIGGGDAPARGGGDLLAACGDAADGRSLAPAAGGGADGDEGPSSAGGGGVAAAGGEGVAPAIGDGDAPAGGGGDLLAAGGAADVGRGLAPVSGSRGGGGKRRWGRRGRGGGGNAAAAPGGAGVPSALEHTAGASTYRQQCAAKLEERLRRNFEVADDLVQLEGAACDAALELERSLFAAAADKGHYLQKVAMAVVDIDRCSRGRQRYNLLGCSAAGAALSGEGAMASTVACAECQQALGGKGWRCGQCRQVAYCGAKCQSRHWPLHKRTCKL